jgi:uncharacterized caspase-like protein
MFLHLLFLLLIPFLLLATTDRSLKIMKVEQRVALVIGNSKYDSKKLPNLKNPINDAKAMSEKLKTLGFKVFYGVNLTKRQMDKKLDQFSQKLRIGGVGLFFFAGHGIEYKRENYLMATNSNVNDKNDVKYESLPLNKILDNMEDAGNRLNIVLLDSCRNDPFSRSGGGGLAKSTARGTYIVYATSPGDVASDGSGKHGAFTKQILKYIDAQGVSIERVFKRVKIGVINSTNQNQRPWISNDITGDFYFKLPTKASDVFEVPKKTNSSFKTQKLHPKLHPKPQENEKRFWEMVVEANTKEYYNFYLEDYPNGYYAKNAKKFIEHTSPQELKQRQYLQQEENRAWENIKDSIDKNDFANFLRKYPLGVHTVLAKQYQDKFKHTVILNGMMWQDNIDSINLKKSYIDANKYCVNLKLAGFTDWKLPNISELQSIVSPNRQSRIKKEFTYVTPRNYWSSSLDDFNSDYAWSISFSDNRNSYSYLKSIKRYIRCVRIIK